MQRKKHFSWKIIHKIWWSNYSQTLCWKTKIDQQSKVLYSLLLLYGKLRGIEIYRNEGADHLTAPHIKLFEKIKRGPELVSLPHFLYNFWRKIFLMVYSITCLVSTKFHCLVAFTLWDIGQYVHCNWL